MIRSGSLSARHKTPSPVALVYDIYGSIFVIALGCLVLGATAMQIASETAGRDPSHVIHFQIFTVAADLFALIAFGFRLRVTMRRLLQAAQQSS
jgi:hypothetical protein